MEKLKKSEIIIVTGLSGAGKSSAIKSIEDFGGFCVDNMPSALIIQFLKLIKTSDYTNSLVALGIDVRTMGFLDKMFNVLSRIENIGFSYKIIFLEADEATIARRYNESRRVHPLCEAGEPLHVSLEKERTSLAALKAKSDVVFDTSNISPHELKKNLQEFLLPEGGKNMAINIRSFGFKYGVPKDIDLLIDTRLLPNPHYHKQLSEKDGKNKEIIDFVMEHKISKEFIENYRKLLEFLLCNYLKEGKSHLTIAVGCTGGKHRSVVMADAFSAILAKHKEYNVYVSHRDIAQ